jgi:hypothetical protein
MNHESSDESQLHPQLEQMVLYLRQHGLATPTLFVLAIARPLGFVAGQCLTLLQPFAHDDGWQSRIGRMATELEDETTWTRLQKLLE